MIYHTLFNTIYQGLSLFKHYNNPSNKMFLYGIQQCECEAKNSHTNSTAVYPMIISNLVTF